VSARQCFNTVGWEWHPAYEIPAAHLMDSHPAQMDEDNREGTQVLRKTTVKSEVIVVVDVVSCVVSRRRMTGVDQR